MTLALRFLCIWLSATLAAYTPGAYRHVLVGLLESHGVPNAKNAPAANLRLRRRLTVDQISSPGVNEDSRKAAGGFVERLRMAFQGVEAVGVCCSAIRRFVSTRLAPSALPDRLLPLRC